jgi:hypothetical protein
MRIIWENEIKDLEAWLEDINTAPMTTRSIVNLLRHMYSGIPIVNPTPIESLQVDLGVTNMVEGLFHVQWISNQQDYYTKHNLRRSGAKWMQMVITQLWSILHRIWKARNEIEHEHDKQIQLRDFNEEIGMEIQQGFDNINRQQYLFSDQAIQKVLQSTHAESKRSWLRNIRALRTSPNPPSQRQRAALRDRSQRIMTDFFTPQGKQFVNMNQQY